MEWIDVTSEKTPLELANDVLLFDCKAQATGIGFLYVNANGRFWHWYSHPDSPIRLDENRISHWMSLPYWWPGLDPQPTELIEVEKELPNPGDTIILFDPWKAGSFSIGRLMPDERFWEWKRGGKNCFIPVRECRVTHWMPLPAPPSTSPC
jgi:hypothetical protein